jgi:8-oxo-dGTP diphosphatase
MSQTKHQSLPLAVCAAVIVLQGKVLLTQRPADKPHGGLWEFPGGKIEAGESPHQSLRREIREELNIEISVDSVLETVYHHYDWGNVLILAYNCSWLSGTITHLEVANHQWVTPDKLSDYQILPADLPIIARIQAGD